MANLSRSSLSCGPEKQANSSPLSLSPFASALSPLAFGSPSSGTRSSQGFPRPDSQPRTSSGARQLGLRTSARRTCHRLCHRSVWLRFWCKKRSKRPTPKSSFFRVRRRAGCLSLKFSLVFGRRRATHKVTRPEIKVGDMIRVKPIKGRGSDPGATSQRRLQRSLFWLLRLYAAGGSGGPP